MRRSVAAYAVLAAIGAVYPAAFGHAACKQGPSAVVRAGERAELVRVPAGRWVLRIRPPESVRALAPGPKTKGKATNLRVACFVRKGRWLSGLLGPSGWIEVRLADEDVAAIDPGSNTVTVETPGWREATIRFDASPLFRRDADVAALVRERLRVAFPPQAGSADDQSAQQVSECAGVTFASGGPRVALSAGESVAFKEIPLTGRARKVYVRARASDAGTPRLSVRASDGRILLPEVVPCGSGEAGKQVFALDVGDESLEAVVLEPPGRGTVEVLGIALLGRLRPGAASRLSARALRMAAGEPIPLFAFDTPSLSGWEIHGKGWGVTDTVGEPFGRKGASRYFADSKANGGEPMTGTILSPPFVLTGSALSFLANGHSAKNYYALVDAATGAELRRSPVPEKTGPFEKIRWDVGDLRGRRVRFTAVDEDTRTGFAWLAFDDITLEP